MPWTGLSHRGLQCNLLWYRPTGQQHYEQFVWRDCTQLPFSNTPIADRFLSDAFLTLIILQLSPHVNISAEFACILKTINKKGLLLTTRLLCIADPVINPFLRQATVFLFCLLSHGHLVVKFPIIRYIASPRLRQCRRVPVDHTLQVIHLFFPERMPSCTIGNNSSINVFLVLHLILSSILDNASVRRNGELWYTRADRRPSSWLARPPVTMNYRCPWLSDGRAPRVLSISFLDHVFGPRQWRRGRATARRFFRVEVCTSGQFVASLRGPRLPPRLDICPPGHLPPAIADIRSPLLGYVLSLGIMG